MKWGESIGKVKYYNDRAYVLRKSGKKRYGIVRKGDTMKLKDIPGVMLGKKDLIIGRPERFGYNDALTAQGEVEVELDVKATKELIFTYLYNEGLSNTYRVTCSRCLDGCVYCEGTGYILSDLGVALIKLAQLLSDNLPSILKVKEI